MNNVDINGSVANDTVEKWSPVLEGIESEYTKRMTAQLLENQAKAIITDKLQERISDDIGGMNTTGRLGTFQKFAFPLVRRVYPELIANNIVGVQPMQGPVSQIFYLGNSRRDAERSGTAELVYSKFMLTYGGKIAQPIFSGANVDIDGLVRGTGAGAGGGDDVNELLGGGGLSGVADAGTDPASVDNRQPLGARIANFPRQDKARGLAAGPATMLGFNLSAGERLSGSGIPEMLFNIEQQPVAARTRKMRALWTLEASQDLKAYHNLDLEQELTDLLGKELRLEIDREIVEDLRMLAYGVGRNTGTAQDWFKRQALDQGFNGPNGPGFNFAPDFNASAFQYDFTGDSDAAGADVDLPGYTRNEAASQYENVFLLDFSSSALDFAPQHVGHVYANLMALCQRVATDIYKTTLRGPGNFMVTSPTVAAMLHAAAKLEGGVMQVDGPTNMTGAKVEYRGKLAGQFDLYVDPLYPEDEILIGYKGANAMDSGYVYCPYIPLQQTPTITDPETFQPRKGIITRYGKAEVSPASRFYRIIRLVGPTSNFLFTPFFQVKNNSYV